MEVSRVMSRFGWQNFNSWQIQYMYFHCVGFFSSSDQQSTLEYGSFLHQELLLVQENYLCELLIGASLSEPHTSMTAMRKCVCIYACLFGPTTYCKFQMSTFKYFTMIACHVHADVHFSQLSLNRENECEGLLPDCKFSVKESESEDDLS